MDVKKTDLFNQVQLGYIVIESNKTEQWLKFLTEGIGLQLSQKGDNAMAFRMDNHTCRILVTKGNAEDVVGFGWHIQNEQALNTIQSRLNERDIAVTTGAPDEAFKRGIKSFWSIKGPKGITFDFYTQPILRDTPVDTPNSGFETGDGGMGHAAIISRHPEHMLQFFTEILDARISDHITQAIAGVTLDFTFLRFNERHHTVAIAASRGLKLDPVRTTVQHFNLMVNSIVDLSATYLRLRKMGYEMAREIGRHPNDEDVSFYVISPSGFEIEVGWGALKVNEENWTINQYNRISQWGHRPQKPGLINFIKVNSVNLWHGVQSLFRKEYRPF